MWCLDSCLRHIDFSRAQMGASGQPLIPGFEILVLLVANPRSPGNQHQGGKQQMFMAEAIDGDQGVIISVKV
jgi:hypothetical protein